MTGPGCGPSGETEVLALVDFEIQVSVGRGSAHPSWQLLRRLSQTGSLLELRSDGPAWPHGETLPQMQRKCQSVSLESASPAHDEVTLQLLSSSPRGRVLWHRPTSQWRHMSSSKGSEPGGSFSPASTVASEHHLSVETSLPLAVASAKQGRRCDS